MSIATFCYDRQHLPFYSSRHGSRRPSGRNAFRLGYQSTMGTDLSGLEERIANHACRGPSLPFRAVYVPADDLTDPAAVHVFSHLSASIVLSRKRASEGLYQRSICSSPVRRWLRVESLANRHYNLAQGDSPHSGAVRIPQGHCGDAGMEQLSLEDRTAVLHGLDGWSAS